MYYANGFDGIKLYEFFPLYAIVINYALSYGHGFRFSPSIYYNESTMDKCVFIKYYLHDNIRKPSAVRWPTGNKWVVLVFPSQCRQPYERGPSGSTSPGSRVNFCTPKSSTNAPEGWVYLP